MKLSYKIASKYLCRTVYSHQIRFLHSLRVDRWRSKSHHFLPGSTTTNDFSSQLEMTYWNPNHIGSTSTSWNLFGEELRCSRVWSFKPQRKTVCGSIKRFFIKYFLKNTILTLTDTLNQKVCSFKI